MKTHIIAVLFSLAILPIAARAQLVDVGNGLINHPAANMTWLADGDPFQTALATSPTLVADIIAAWEGPLYFGHVLSAADFDAPNATMTYWGAIAWINYLNSVNHLGYNDWRMPYLGAAFNPNSCGGICYSSAAAAGDSEYFKLFYRELGGVARVSIHTTHNANYDLFTRIGSGWSQTRAGDLVNIFGVDGGQGRIFMSSMHKVWPVRTGLSMLNPPPRGRIIYSKLEINFPEQITLSRSEPQTITLTNRGAAPSLINSMQTVSPIQDDEFVVTHDCATPIPVGASCTASVTFRPQDLFQTRGTLTIVADDVPTTFPLFGTGALGVYLNESVTMATAGSPVTLSWSTSTVNTRSCAASGGTTGDGWAGPAPVGGSRTVTSAVAGTVVYTISCEFGPDKQGVDTSTIVYTVPSVTIAAGSTNIQQGQSNTLTWTATNAEACTSTGNGVAGQWGGVRTTSGTATVVETTLGMISYNISCTAGSQTSQASVNVFVNAPPAPSTPPRSGGGGGAIELYSLVALSLALAAAARERRRGRWAR